ncbi:hypothetical protein L1987_21487 [Smallanthus sonchifolius]|uniref:Uncharacterized protein n=1 Tax=Smallanthus sonchifolius TaxID=185202 RepID=A0ACB9IV87_9ASTR|nr:hypothetical protein L1987_21487 [Smallanthus sonchifolius]
MSVHIDQAEILRNVMILNCSGNLIKIDCPVTQSEDAGKSDACVGCPNQEACASASKGPDPGSLFHHLSISEACP